MCSELRVFQQRLADLLPPYFTAPLGKARTDAAVAEAAAAAAAAAAADGMAPAEACTTVVLHLDVCGFTAMSAAMPPTAVVLCPAPNPKPRGFPAPTSLPTPDAAPPDMAVALLVLSLLKHDCGAKAVFRRDLL